ncbi:Hypothetical protein NTJ_03361 [Nesidiocoris tenuis]|uniref:Uncharacterized protein n=2 Tax=Nesidiocoris tenuis TaxID=355587 RepID=A0ABN7AE44_9HEMI|nr:Hypothetical protein NTJ_03361 [Nesidiocoris tenuis]
MLPRCTPTYLLRLETGRATLGLKVRDRAVRWWHKVLLMEPSIHPCICFQQLLAVVERGLGIVECNWTIQLKGILQKLQFKDAWDRQDPNDVLVFSNSPLLSDQNGVPGLRTGAPHEVQSSLQEAAFQWFYAGALFGVQPVNRSKKGSLLSFVYQVARG